MKHDWEQRKTRTEDLLQHIRLGLIPTERLIEHFIDFKLLDIPECKEMLEDVMEVIVAHTQENATMLLISCHPDLFASRNTITVSLNSGCHNQGVGGTQLWFG